MTNKDKELWKGEYISLWKSGYIGVSDGVGFVGTEIDLKGLFKALKKYFENDK
jgi:hypothetical protein